MATTCIQPYCRRCTTEFDWPRDPEDQVVLCYRWLAVLSHGIRRSSRSPAFDGDKVHQKTWICCRPEMPLLKHWFDTHRFLTNFYNILDFVYFNKTYLVKFSAIQRRFRGKFSTTIRNIIVLERLLIVSQQPWNQNGKNENEKHSIKFLYRSFTTNFYHLATRCEPSCKVHHNLI